MNTSDLGGSFSVDGHNIDLSDFGWEDAPKSQKRRPEDGLVRLQKALAGAGVASRRACETLITKGRVQVNGDVVEELGTKIDPDRDEIRVDGVIVQLDVSKRYFILNKPRGIVSTMKDEKGRPDLREFTDLLDGRYYNVGRLDTDTSGLLILTNDGELAHQLAHPKFGVQKTYIAKVRGTVTAGTIQKMKDGITLEDGPIHADRAALRAGGSTPKNSDDAVSLVELTLHSGKNRIVRRMLAAVGHPVIELVRRQFGPLNLGTLALGELRELSDAERGALLTAADGDSKITAGRPGDGAGAKGMRGIAKPQPQRKPKQKRRK